MKNVKSRNIGIYSRKSKFTGKGESVENQIELCRQYISTHFPDVEDEKVFIYEDEGFSGGNTARPQFQKMLKDVKGNQLEAIVCYRLDRISRKITDFAELTEILNEHDTSFVSIREHFDTTTPMGRAMMFISSVFAQLERETLQERLSDNLLELAKTGRWLGGMTPTGYASESVESFTLEGKVKTAHKLKPVPEEAAIVKHIFAKFIETNSLTKTETWLLLNHYSTKNGIPFSRFAIKNILQNPVYLIADHICHRYFTAKNAALFSPMEAFDDKHGIMAYNRTLQKTGKATQLRPMEEWIIAVGKHEGFISGVQWVKAQELLEKNRDKNYRQPRSIDTLLSGILFCQKCGSRMRPKTTGNLTASGEPIFTYVCSLKEKSRGHHCHMRNAHGNTLDKMICDQIKNLTEDRLEFIAELEQSKTLLVDGQNEALSSLASNKETFADNEKKIKGLVFTLADAEGTSAKQYILEEIETLHKANETLKEHLTKLETLTSSQQSSSLQFDIFSDMLLSFKNTIDIMNAEEKRNLIRAIVKKVVWTGDEAHLYIWGSEEDVDSLNKSNAFLPSLREDSK